MRRERKRVLERERGRERQIHDDFIGSIFESIFRQLKMSKMPMFQIPTFQWVIVERNCRISTFIQVHESGNLQTFRLSNSGAHFFHQKKICSKVSIQWICPWIHIQCAILFLAVVNYSIALISYMPNWWNCFSLFLCAVSTCISSIFLLTHTLLWFDDAHAI